MDKHTSRFNDITMVEGKLRHARAVSNSEVHKFLKWWHDYWACCI